MLLYCLLDKLSYVTADEKLNDTLKVDLWDARNSIWRK